MNTLLASLQTFTQHGMDRFGCMKPEPDGLWLYAPASVPDKPSRCLEYIARIVITERAIKHFDFEGGLTAEDMAAQVEAGRKQPKRSWQDSLLDRDVMERVIRGLTRNGYTPTFLEIAQVMACSPQAISGIYRQMGRPAWWPIRHVGAQPKIAN